MDDFLLLLVRPLRIFFGFSFLLAELFLNLSRRGLFMFIQVVLGGRLGMVVVAEVDVWAVFVEEVEKWAVGEVVKVDSSALAVNGLSLSACFSFVDTFLMYFDLIVSFLPKKDFPYLDLYFYSEFHN